MDAFVTRKSITSREPNGAQEIPDSDDDEVSSVENEAQSEGASFSKRQDGEPPLEKQHRVTDVESALPQTETGPEAIQEYENFKLSQTQSQDESKPEGQATWVRGRSSIYVDAFNLALDTVLEEETHLFDDKEMDIFRQWRDLNYESQYLYVRLFLHISDPEKAIETLQIARGLPNGAKNKDEAVFGSTHQEPPLGDTFTFADRSEEFINTLEEAAPLLNMEELKALAKEAKVQGRNKPELIRSLCRMSQQQTSLMSLGLSRHNSRDESSSSDCKTEEHKTKKNLRREDSNREKHFFAKVTDTLGPCIRLSPVTYNLFERVHLVFYRSTEWTEKSLTTIILAKIARRHFPEYVVCRTSTIFASRAHLVEFENAIKLESEVDRILEFGETPGEAGFDKVMQIFDQVYPRWKEQIDEEREKEQRVYEMGEGTYLRRFVPAHSYTRIIHKALHVLARRKEHAREHALLTELLDQRLFHMARRGSWYQRKALLEEHYMAELDAHPVSESMEQQKKHWRKTAATTCATGLQDPECHIIYHFDLQKRLIKLEKKLRIPKRLQHDFGHVRLADPIDITVEGIQLKRELAPNLAAKPHRQKRFGWMGKILGYHAEGGIVRTIFAYLFYDILFLYLPNVFQTAYQTCPLDLHTDSFYPARASEINHRLVEIANGEGERLVREVWAREHERQTSVIGLNWDFDIEDIAELVRFFEGSALATVCKMMAQEYRHRGGGIPDLLLWRHPEATTDQEGKKASTPSKGEVMFAEVKSTNDRLSDTQRLWIHVLTGAGIKVALCNAVATEVREVD
uniref:Fanconi-associated nuclease n=1 Tax=Bionectria ochroleuca TaxID=29856 RepID=A0A8H7N9E1_BIOOC